MTDKCLYTKWGRQAQEDAADPAYVPLPEYPRPHLVRSSWRNLNGWWTYKILGPGLDLLAQGRILVPFSPETALSGVGRVLQPGQILCCSRILALPEDTGAADGCTAGDCTADDGTAAGSGAADGGAAGAGRRLLLHFGAVDERCIVRVNGHYAGSHQGGYTAFTLDITDLLQAGDNRLEVEIRDDSDTAWQARGKQKLSPGGMFYQSQSGIWKAVWCEWVPAVYVRRLRFEADLQAESASMTLELGGIPTGGTSRLGGSADAPAADSPASPASVEITAAYTDAATGEARCVREVLPAAEEVTLTLPVPAPRLWSPEDPYLYPVRVTLRPVCGEAEVTDHDVAREADRLEAGHAAVTSADVTGSGDPCDVVETYLAMRTIGISPADEDTESKTGSGAASGGKTGRPRRLLLNGKPYFMHGVLDQGYWPESLMTPPADAALEWDIQSCRELGFNMLRKHVKVEASRFYYHCDRLGMLVWQDAVNGGRSYNANLVTNLPNILPAVQTRIGDTTVRDMDRLGRQDSAGREAFRRELREMVEELRFHPSVCVWVPFNEGWGQFDSLRIAEEVRRMDPTRPVDAASGWFDRGGGDFYSVHNYFRRLRIPAARAAERAAALTEYGGLSRSVEGLTAANGMKAYRSLDSEQSLTETYVRLVRRDILSQLPAGLCAAVYTQLSDVEGEINGLFTYDRSLCKMTPDAVRAARAEIDEAWAGIFSHRQEIQHEH